MKTKINVTLSPENLEWVDVEVAESRFTSRSAGVDFCILATRKRESPEALQAASEMEMRLRDAEVRARKAEAALETIRREIENEIVAAIAPAQKETLRQLQVLGEDVKRALHEAYDEARAEREKRARAEEDTFRKFLEVVRAEGEVKRLQTEIEQLKGTKAEAAEGVLSD